jgi:hypothetical protein
MIRAGDSGEIAEQALARRLEVIDAVQRQDRKVNVPDVPAVL